MKVKFLSIKDLRAKKPAEINKYIIELKQAQAELAHAIATNKDKQTHQLGQIRTAVARAYTVAVQQQTYEKEKK